MAAEIERKRESPPDVVEAIGQPLSRFGEEEIMGAEAGGGAVAVPADGRAIERGDVVAHGSLKMASRPDG